MKFCISLGKFELKYFFYCALFFIIEINIYLFIYNDKDIIISKQYLLHSFCFFLGYLLNFIPTWISHIKTKKKEKPKVNKLKEDNNNSIEYIYYKPYEEYLSLKDILKFFFISLILLFADLIESIEEKIDDKDTINENSNGNNNSQNNKKYSDNFIFIEFLIFFIVSKFRKEEVYYKHQNISFFILILLEAVKNIYFFKKKLCSFSIIEMILNAIYSILYAIYFLYIKGFMKYKFISPAKCNFLIGIINTPIIILIYFIISFTPLGKDNNEYYYDNIFKFFNDLGKIEAKSLIILILLPFVYGILHYTLIKIIYDYTIFHMYIPFMIENFIENIIQNFGKLENIFLISSFFVELIIILVFLEIIEINCCGLNKNLKRNIELRGTIDSSLAIENDDDDDDDDKIDERNDKIISTTKY